MKIFISADIEGTAGISGREEAGEGDVGFWYGYFRKQMTAEVAAACKGALAAGADDVLVRDAHYTARNIDPSGLPKGVRLARGWSNDPWCMVSGAEGSDALMMTGYHAPSYSPASPLSHTMTDDMNDIFINGRKASEFLIHSYAAGYLGVPIVFLSGDAGICEEAREFLPGITTVATGEGVGDCMVGMHPQDAEEAIAAGAKKALSGPLDACRVVLPGHFEVVVSYKAHQKARHNSFYPGARLAGERSVAFETEDYFEVMRFFHFALM